VRSLTTRKITDLITEQGTLTPLPLRLVRAWCTMPGSGVVTALSRALAEQLRKQLHGRFPLTETDPPVGQDEP